MTRITPDEIVGATVIRVVATDDRIQWIQLGLSERRVAILIPQSDRDPDGEEWIEVW